MIRILKEKSGNLDPSCEELKVLELASEMNLKSAQNGLEEMRSMMKTGDLRKAPRKPIKASATPDGNPLLNIEIRSNHARQREGEDDHKHTDNDVGSRINDHGSSFPKEVGTPSQSVQRKSLEKWIYPDAEKVGKKKIDLARAILNDNDRPTKKVSSQDLRFKSLNDSKSARSDRSVDEVDHTHPSYRVFKEQIHTGTQPELPVGTNSAASFPDKSSHHHLYEDDKNNLAREIERDQVLLENQYDDDVEHSELAVADGDSYIDKDKIITDVKPALVDPVTPSERPIHHQNDSSEHHRRTDANQHITQPNSAGSGPTTDPAAPSVEVVIHKEVIAITPIKDEFPNHLTSPFNSYLNQHSPDHNILIDNRDIHSLNDLVDPNVLPSFDRDHSHKQSPMSPEQPSPLELEQYKLEKERAADELSQDILSGLLDELVLNNFMVRVLEKLREGMREKMGGGIRTNINCVKNYLATLTEYIVTNFVEGVRYQLNNPLGPTPEERLRLFHAVGDEENMDSSYARINYEQVLDIEIYFDFEDHIMVGSN